MTEQEAPRRHFHLADGIILIVAAAVMFTAERTVYWAYSAFSSWFQDAPSWNPGELRRMACSLALAELSLVLLLPILIRPKDRGRLRQGAPGLLVHPAVAIVVTVRILGWLAQGSISALFEGRPGIYGNRWTVEILNYLRDDLRKDAVMAILASWLSLTLVRRWNPERAWDDRLGRLVAAVWGLFYLAWQLQVFLP